MATLISSTTGGIFKRGTGSLRLTADNSATLGGPILVGNGTLVVASDGALGDTGTGNETIVNDASFSANQALRLRFQSGVTYTHGETIQVLGNGGTESFGAAIYGGDTSAASFAGTLQLLGNTTVSGGATFSGGLTLGGTLGFGSGTTTLTKIGAAPLRFDNMVFAGNGMLNVDISPSPDPDNVGLEVNVSSGMTTMNGRITSGDGTSSFAGNATKEGNGLFETRLVRVDGLLNISAGTLAIIDNGSSSAVSRCGYVLIPGNGTTTYSSTLDLADNDLIVDYGNKTLNPKDMIRLQIASARGSGSWDGYGITSHLANAGTFALGYADAVKLGSGSTSYAGITIDTDTVVIKYTYYGDTNLDGMVDIVDLGTLAGNWQTTGMFWQDGDSNYDGNVDIVDLGALATNWEMGIASPLFSDPPTLYEALSEYPDLLAAALEDPYLIGLLSAEGSFSKVPEPRTAMLLVTAALTSVAQRRRGFGRRRDRV